MTVETLVVVGGGLAGAKAVEGARAAGYAGRVLLVGEEAHLPYERPPLSKGVLRGEAEPSTTEVAGDAFIGEHAVDMITGTAASGIDLAGRRVLLDGESGGSLPFDALVLATGATPRRLAISGAELEGVHYLRTLDQAEALGKAIRSAGRVAVIGAGWIGSEVAASARQMGAEVVMIDPGEVPLQRVLGNRIGATFAELHRENGVVLRMGRQVRELQGGNRVESVVLDDGRVETADVVVVGIGVEPASAIAAAAGLGVDNGIVVDQWLRTTAEGVYAAGDVANAFHPHYEKHLRVEHWSNAVHQGTAAGHNAVGDRQVYERLPYFFSDQFDLGMEYVGLAGDGDEVVIRGDLAKREFIAWWHRNGSVTAAMNVNIWDVADDLRAIVGSKERIDPARLADVDTPLAEMGVRAA